jgi:histone deacetylase HOS3
MDLPSNSPASLRSPSALSQATSVADGDELSNTMRNMNLSQGRRYSAVTPQTPRSRNAPPTPTSGHRPSSSFALRQSASSPRPGRQGSRSSLGGPSPQRNLDDPGRGITPKKSISNLISGLREAQAQSNMEAIAEPVYLTPPDIAKVHFARELLRLETADSETMVVLHDACYGHRFSRTRTSKGALSMIVERPERLHAGVLGAAMAFVRMGGHHEGGTNAPTIDREVQDQPPFRIRRTARTLDVTSDFVTNVHGTAWMGELRGMCNNAGERLAKGEKELARESTTEDGEKRTLHEGDLYLCSESLDAFQGAMGGVADAIDAIFAPELQTRRAFVAVRPPGHHCSADYPSGFCWINNVHVGVEYAAQTHGLTHAAIIDFDLHHGDGSQSITWDRNSKNNIKRLTARPNSKLKLGPDIGYYSLHDINSYPCEGGDDQKVQAASLCIDNAHGQSIWNVHLQPWKTEEEFWDLYESRYKVLLEKARGFLQHHTSRLHAEGKVQPKAAIFISAGFDASEWEGAGMQRHKVNVPTEFYARFTRDMVQLAQEEGTGCDGRVVSVLEGGYSDRALCSGVLSHLSGLSRPSKPPTPATTNDASSGIDQYMRGLSLHNGSIGPTYDKHWWHEENLTALEMKVNPPPPTAPGGKKFRTGNLPTYATPTESFAYKVYDPQKFARSISGTMRESHTIRPRGPAPPAPDIDWVVATQELAKLLIPQDRQTKSCTPEQLAGPKKVAVAPTAVERDPAERPRQLRTRAAKPSYRENPDEISRADRRRTIADLPPSTEPASSAAAPARRSSRRSSLAITLNSEPMEAASDAPPVPPVVTTTNAMQPPPAPANVPGGLAVKKIRAPPKLKKPTASASAPVSPFAASKHQPAPPFRQATPQSTEAQSPPTTNATNAGSAMSPNSAMDALTNGLKKVTLKLGTREEHDRKVKERIDSERRARALKGAETRRVNKAAKDAKLAESKVTPAQRAKVGPVAGAKEAAIAAVRKHVPEPLVIAPPPQESSSSLQPHETATSQVPFAQAATTAVPQVNNTQTPYEATTSPPFNMPTYNPSPTTTYPPPAGAAAAAPPPPPPAATSSPLASPAFRPQSLQQSRKSSESSLYRFVPVMETTPPSSRPSSTRAMSFPANLPPPPVAAVETRRASQTIFEEEKPGLPDRAASSSNVFVDNRPQLPVFSATGPIPFARVGQSTQPTATVGQSGDEAHAGAADSHVWATSNRPTG